MILTDGIEKSKLCSTVNDKPLIIVCGGGQADASETLSTIPQQHPHESVHRARHGAADDPRSGDGEHLHHRPRDEALCLSQVKHKNYHYLTISVLASMCLILILSVYTPD